MRTTSMASGVVTRSPPRNSDSMPRRSSMELICGPPPCTTTGWIPTWCRKTMSSAKARRRSSLTMALPPYLTTMVVPAKCWIHGSASMSASALRCAVSQASPESVSKGRAEGPAGVPAVVSVFMVVLAGVGGVLVHVVVREVVGPEGGLRGSGVEVDLHEHVAAGEVDQGPVLADAPGAADLHAVDGNVQPVGLEGGAGGAHGGEHAAPVGVLA